MVGVALLWAGGDRVQAKRAPSTLLPMEPLWTTVLSASPAATPVHDAGRIFVVLRDGHVAAVNVDDGDVVWEIVQEVVGQPAVGERCSMSQAATRCMGSIPPPVERDGRFRSRPRCRRRWCGMPVG